jgi:hypothetical protein
MIWAAVADDRLQEPFVRSEGEMMPEEEKKGSDGGESGSDAGEKAADDLPAGDLPAIPLWVVWAGFGVWAAWLIFLAVAAFSVQR